MELDYVQHAVACFGEWAAPIENIKTNQIEDGADA
jgi:hypothetical protein